MHAFQRAAKGSDRMLTFLLKSHRPEVYNERVRASTAKSSTEDPDSTFSLAEIYEKVRQWEVDDKWEELASPEESVPPQEPPPPHESFSPQEEG